MNKNVIGTDAFFFFLIMHFSSRLGICILVNNSKSKGGIKERKTVLGGGEVSLERPEKYWASILKKIHFCMESKIEKKKKYKAIQYIDLYYVRIINFLYELCQGQYRYKDLIWWSYAALQQKRNNKKGEYFAHWFVAWSPLSLHCKAAQKCVHKLLCETPAAIKRYMEPWKVRYYLEV